MIGKTKIELTDINTGEVQVIESENMVTEAFARLVKPRFNPARSFLDATNGGSEAKSSIAATGGVFLLRDTIEENASNYLFPAGAEVTGRASVLAYNSTDTQLGSYNRNESNFEDMGNYLKWVWDFNPSQANGQISCVCLSTDAGGRLGLGSNTMMQANEGYTKENIYEMTSYAFPDTYLSASGIAAGWAWRLDDEAGVFVTIQQISNQTKLRILKMSLDAPQTSFFCNRNFKSTKMPTERHKNKETYVDYSDITSNMSNMSGAVGDDGFFYFTIDSYVQAGATFGLHKVDEEGNRSTITVTNTTGEELNLYVGRKVAFRVSHNYFCALGVSKKLWAINLNNNTDVFNFKLTNGTDVTGNVVWTACGGSEDIINTGTSLCYVLDGQNCKQRREGSPPQADCIFNKDKTIRAYVYWYNYTNIYYLYMYYNPFLLVTINNLAVPVEKTASQSMRVTYTLLREGYTPPAGD